MDYKKAKQIAGWAVFIIAFVVYYFSAERTGSLWDCGEFITGAYKLQVVHPPGAPVFLLIGRMFTFIAEVVSNDPADIAFAVNLLSGICTAFAAMFVCWVTMILGRMTLTGRNENPNSDQSIALLGAGLVAGLSTAFCTSIWFSAVEGEVYAMSTMFTALTLWAVIKWYELPDTPQSDRWLVFAVYSAGLSIGVHLLSLLTFPALALFYYFKKYQNPTLKGMVLSAGIGVGFIAAIQLFVILGIPQLWSYFELLTVNGFGFPPHSGLVPLIIFLGALSYLGLRFAAKKQNALFQKIVVASTLVVIAFSTLGMVVIRANADTPINMNSPSDAMRLIPYLNREQYGERPLLRGPHFDAPVIKVDTEDRYGLVGDKYEIVDRKASYVYANKDKMFFPRMTHQDESRKSLYKRWMGGKNGPPSQADNISFFLRYQVGWMYWRYFMWNFSGRQNGEQGFMPWDKSSGHWLSGIPFIDNIRLHNQSDLPESMANHEARNAYYMLPFIFGLIGLFYHARRRGNDFLGLLTLFIITGIGIIVYSNQPPNEPRERDYVLAGSFFTYCIWIGMGVLAIFNLLMTKANLKGSMAAPVAAGLVLIAPILMGFENFDDNSRRHHSGSRDYASNFLNSCEPNSIIFTYGDNDTYPLWYAQEVEGIRTDVRVVNLSLIAVDWYIDQLRRKVNDSEAINMSIPRDAYRGMKRTQLFFVSQDNPERNLAGEIKFMGENNPLRVSDRTLESYARTRKYFIPVNKNQVINNGTVNLADSARIVDRVRFTFPRSTYIQKGELALLDIVSTNAFKRPIYFAVTCREESLQGLDNYLQLEGLALKLVPIRSEGEPRYGMVGKGRVNTDAVYNNFMNEFRWGGFDKRKLFVDRSYGPSVQTMRVTVMRTVGNMVRQGDKQRAVQLLDKYFEAFPHMNFTYDAHALLLMQFYIQAGAYEKAKPHLEILAKETEERLNFYMFSLDPDDLQAGFGSDFQAYRSIKDELLRIAKQQKDTEFEAKLNERFEPFG